MVAGATGDGWRVGTAMGGGTTTLLGGAVATFGATGEPGFDEITGLFPDGLCAGTGAGDAVVGGLAGAKLSNALGFTLTWA